MGLAAEGSKKGREKTHPISEASMRYRPSGVCILPVGSASKEHEPTSVVLLLPAQAAPPQGAGAGSIPSSSDDREPSEA